MAGCIALAVATLAAEGRAQVSGSNGAAGTRGADGVAGGDGTDGTAGGDGIRQSLATSTPNTIAALGGAGGDGGHGSPPEGRGGRGGAGGGASATAVTTTLDPFGRTTIDATGGRGGSGGRPGNPATGSGGSGGDGGGAEVRADVTSSQVTAHAVGGAGGVGFGVGSQGGAGGAATGDLLAISDRLRSLFLLEGGAGGAGQLGAAGGDGGDAELVSPRPGTPFGVPTSGLVRASESITAVGGNAGSSTTGAAGRGGDASLAVERILDPGGEHALELSASGGRGGNAESGGAPGLGGDAEARARVELAGTATVAVRSTGGSGGLFSTASSSSPVRDGAAAGRATGSATAVSTLANGRAEATTVVVGGQGGSGSGIGARGADGGTIVGTAEARTGASGTAKATVEARGGSGGAGLVGADGGAGGDALLVNAASGTGERVELRQAAFGGGGGIASRSITSPPGAGRGGDAVSLLDRTNLEGSLLLDSRATGGIGGAGGGVAGRATAGGTAVARTTATVFAKATGGTGGTPLDVDRFGADGAEAALAPIRGRAELGVDLTGWLEGGSGAAGTRVSGRGADARVVDALDAETSGIFRATQVAVAGRAGETRRPDMANSGARGGDATSRLTLDESVSQLFANVAAVGGRSTGRDAAGVGRAGGRADVELTATNRTGGIESAHRAIGGVGSDAGGAGGDARSLVRLTTTGDGHDIVSSRFPPYLDGIGYLDGTTGGQGGDAGEPDPATGVGGRDAGRGGDATTELDARALGDSRIDVTASARGGTGGTSRIGSAPGSGGNARAVARGVNDGASEVMVVGRAEGGAGGLAFFADPLNAPFAGDGGSAEVEAFGESLGGGGVTVVGSATGGSASLGRGGSIRLVDAVGGATSGQLALLQAARGGESFPGIGGDAESRLSHVDEDGGGLELVSGAFGGAGRAGGGDAVAAARGVGRDDVIVEVSARAGDAKGADATTGRARIDEAYGESLGGGRVDVRAWVGMGSGRSVATGSREASVDAPLDAIVDNRVDGRTTGVLALSQSAIGGNAIGDATGPGSIVRAGSALSRLDRRVSASRLEVTLDASGGTGVSAVEPVRAPSDGGNASVVARLVNETGGVSFRGNARGGDGGLDESFARGGDASLDVEIETRGDGADIVFDPSSPIRGGDAHLYGTSAGGTAGDAVSRSAATARGDSAVEVFDQAVGGQGARSGSARSFASGANAGSQRVHVSSSAESGQIVGLDGPIDRGAARAEARGFSPAGEVDAEARATSNPDWAGSYLLSDQWSGGQALAIAAAEGSASRATAEASGMTGAIGELAVGARAGAYGQGSGAIEARAASGSGASIGPMGPGPGVFAAVDGIHARAGEWGRGEIGMRADRTGPDIVLGGELEFFGVSYLNPTSDLFVSFLALELDDDDFTALAFRLSDGDEELLARSFTDAASARAFFGTPLSIAALRVGLPEPAFSIRGLRVSVEGEGLSATTDFRLALAVGRSVVPEPGAATLIAVGLAILGMGRGDGGRGSRSARSAGRGPSRPD